MNSLVPTIVHKQITSLEYEATKAIRYPEQFILKAYDKYPLKQWKPFLGNKRTQLVTFKGKVLIFPKSQGVVLHTL